MAPNASTENSRPRIVQVDGPNSSDEDDDEDGFDDDGDEHDDDEDDQNDEDNDGPGEEEEPLNSEDDVSDEDPTELFETDNVVVCQYDKVRVTCTQQLAITSRLDFRDFHSLSGSPANCFLAYFRLRGVETSGSSI